MGNDITVSEAASLRGLSVATVRYWCRQEGWLKSARKSGGTWLIDKDEVLAFVPPKPGPEPGQKRARRKNEEGD